MTADINSQGVTTENVADSQTAETTHEPSNQEINWQKANETMSEQKRRLEQLEQQNQTYQQQLGVFQNYMTQMQQQPAQSARSPLDNLAEDDVVTGGEVKAVLQNVISQQEQSFQQKVAQYEQQMQIMQMKSQFPDYENVVRETVKMAEQNPALAEAIRTSSNPGLLAYQIGRNANAGAAQPSQQVEEARRMVENAQKPGSLAGATGGGGALSKADFFLNMSEQDFEQHVAKVKRGLN